MSPPLEDRSGNRILAYLTVVTFAACCYWMLFRLPRVSGDDSWSPVLEDGAHAFAYSLREDLARRLRLLHEETGIEFHILTHPRDLAEEFETWKQTRVREQLEALPDGIPRVLLLIGGASPMRFDLRWNQGLEEVLDPAFLGDLERRQVTPMLRRERPDLAADRVVRQVSERIRGVLEEPREPGKFYFGGPTRRWTRRFSGVPEGLWHQRLGQAFLVALGGFFLLLLGTRTGRGLLGSFFFSSRRPPPPVPFTGGATSGGFGGAALGGGASPLSW